MTAEFGARTTTDEVLDGIDLSGRRVLVTGVSSGLGSETARAIAAHGGRVVGTARTADKARAAEAALSASGAVEVVACDLTDLADVRACAASLLARGEPFDVVIANAGVMASPEMRTAEGFELQFGTNHLGHFVLVNRLAPLLRSGGRLVVLASRGHRIADVDLDDPNFERTPYDPLIAYGRSKTANVLFAVEFDRRHRARGIRATALHPGGIRTPLLRHMTPTTMQALIETSSRMEAGTDEPAPGLKTVQQGAATSLWAAFVAPAAEIGGAYCEDCHVAAVMSGPGRGGVQAYALDGDRARALWARSEALVVERFPAPGPEAAPGTPERRSAEQTVRAFLACFREPDLDEILGFFHPDATYTDPRSATPVTGIEALGREFGAQIRGVPSTDVHVAALVSDGRTVMLERVEDFPWNGRLVHMEGVQVYEIDGDGRIVRMRDYYDRGAFAAV